MDISQLQNNQFLITAIIVGITGGLVYYGKSLGYFIYNQVRRRFIFSVTIESNQYKLYRYINNYLYENCHKQFRNVLGKLTMRNDEEYVVYEQHIDTYYVKHKNVWVKISKEREKLEGANDIHQAHMDSFVLTSLNRAKLTSLLEYIYTTQEEKARKEIEVNIYSNGDYNRFNTCTTNRSLGIKSVVLPDELKNEICDDIKTWIANEKWYRSRGLKYKRGYLLYGEPGNGKTSLIAAIAKEFSMDIYTINLANLLKDSNLTEVIYNISSGKAIIVFEDIDSVFNLRENKVKDSKLTFSGLINALDGLMDIDSKLLFITTNKPEVLDEALIRPGRIDKKYLLPKPDINLINAYIRVFYDINYDLVENYNHNISFAELQNLCIIHKHNVNELREKLCVA